MVLRENVCLVSNHSETSETNCLKKNLNASRPSEYPPVREGGNVCRIQRIGCQPEITT